MHIALIMKDKGYGIRDHRIEENQAWICFEIKDNVYLEITLFNNDTKLNYKDLGVECYYLKGNQDVVFYNGLIEPDYDQLTH